MGVGGQCHTPVALCLGKTQYPLYRRLDGPQGQSRHYKLYKRAYINCLIGTEIMFLSWCITGMVFIRTEVKIYKISNRDVVSMIKLESSLLVNVLEIT